MTHLKKKRFRDTPAFGNTLALLGIVFVIGVMGILYPRQATSLELPPTHVTEERVDCVPIYLAGEMIMRYRQDGVPLIALTEMFHEYPALMPTVKDSFKVSEFELEKNQDKAVKEFAEKLYNECEAEQDK